VWGITLSGPLPIVALVSRYLTNKLIGRMLIFNHRSFNCKYDVIKQYYEVLIQISLGYPSVKGRLHTRYSPVRHSSSDASTNVTVRLACVKPAASVHPEPGSNSSLYKSL
jgi:hypothetical protein